MKQTLKDYIEAVGLLEMIFGMFWGDDNNEVYGK